MAFVRSFVCMISVIATDKVRYSMVPGRTERDGGGREEMRREYGIEMNNKRQKERKSFAREPNTHLYALVCTYTLHAYDSHKSQTSAFIVRCVTATREEHVFAT